MANVVTLGGRRQRSVGDPNPIYDSLAPVYERNRAALEGQRYVKELDRRVAASNLLIPFSPSMSQEQYQWYLAEAEWPGYSQQFARTLIGGLLRKNPRLVLPEDAPEEAQEWLMNNFTGNDRSLVSFLDEALWEELTTSRAWVCVNYPVTDEEEFSPEELEPYPILLNGESIINWSEGLHPVTLSNTIDRLIVRFHVAQPDPENEFHDRYVDTVFDHYITAEGIYKIDTYERQDNDASDDTPVISGNILQNYVSSSEAWELVSEEIPLRNGEPLQEIPIFPLNGRTEPEEPMLTNLINREVGLYNRISRRNHLLYGSASYTPVIRADALADEDKQAIVSAGLGSWIFLGSQDSADILSAPTDALQDLDRAIEQTIEEMARLGMRILAPERGSTAETSGVALEIRNAAQTSQLATLNAKISESFRSIIAMMVNWRYNTEYEPSDIEFEMSQDFSPVPTGADFMRLVTEWYQGGLIPRSVFLDVVKQNDLIPDDYDDEEGQAEIEADPNVVSAADQFAQEMEMQEAQMEQAAASPPGADQRGGQ